jgi:hypothetical protein
MNHRGAEVTEKKKKRSSSSWTIHKRIISATLVFVCILAVILNIAYPHAMRAYNRWQYQYHLQQWQQYGEVDVAAKYVSGGHVTGFGEFWDSMYFVGYMRDFWMRAKTCIDSHYCQIRFNGEHHYPEYMIYGNRSDREYQAWRIDEIAFCDVQNYLCDTAAFYGNG